MGGRLTKCESSDVDDILFHHVQQPCILIGKPEVKKGNIEVRTASGIWVPVKDIETKHMQKIYRPPIIHRKAVSGNDTNKLTLEYERIMKTFVEITVNKSLHLKREANLSLTIPYIDLGIKVDIHSSYNVDEAKTFQTESTFSMTGEHEIELPSKGTHYVEEIFTCFSYELPFRYDVTVFGDLTIRCANGDRFKRNPTEILKDYLSWYDMHLVYENQPSLRFKKTGTVSFGEGLEIITKVT